MTTLTVLEEQNLQEIIDLVDSASEPTSEEMLHYDKVYGPGIKSKVVKRAKGIVCKPLGIKNNPRLINILTEVTKLNQSSLVSVHKNSYKEGVSLGNHYDGQSRQTFVILLKVADEGGEFIFENKEYHFEKGSVLNYNGMKTNHGVSEVRKGFRETLVLFYGNEGFSKSTL